MRTYILGGLAAGGVLCACGLAIFRTEPPSRVSSIATAPPSPVLLSVVSEFSPPLTAQPAAELSGPTALARLMKQEPAEAPGAIFAFSNWAQGFTTGGGKGNVGQGVALAWKRHQSMLELIERDPQKALELAVPLHWRRALPETVTRYLEEQVDGRGVIDVAIADRMNGGAAVYRQARIGDRTYQAFVYGRRLSQGCLSNAPLHGIAIGKKLAVDSNPIRFLDAEEAQVFRKATDPVCCVCGQRATGPAAQVGDAGGEFLHFCGVDHAELVNTRWIKQERQDSHGKGGLQAKLTGIWTLGPKGLLYMRVNFPDDLTEPVSEAAAGETMTSVNDFYVENSYDLTSLTTTVTPLLTLPGTKAWYSDAGPFVLLNDARMVAFKAGYDTEYYELDVVCHTAVPGFDWAGLGMVGGKGTWLQNSATGVTAHELGHNYGLPHANFWDTSTNDNSGIGPGLSVEYGNIYDTMGQPDGGRNHFNSLFKSILDWLPEGAVANATTSGVYRIHCFDVPERLAGRTYATRIQRDFERQYWLEMRQQFTPNRWLDNGILLNWSPWEGSKGGSELIDTTPGSPTADLSRRDAALIIGRTFSDVPAGIHITPLGRGVDETNAWMDVQINLGAFPDNQPPALTVEMDPPAPSPGTLVHFHASGSDPDGDPLAYAWWFDDSDFSTNNLPWAYKTWSAPGERVVRCVVSDMKGGIASANQVVTVGKSLGTRITGTITDTNGLPIEGARVDNLADTNALQSVTGYTDTDGHFVIVGVTNDINLLASKYGFTFTNLTWTNPILAGTSLLQADFIATALPVVSIRLTTNEVVETSTETNYFVLRRTGDTSTNLIVYVFLSGSAIEGRDYRLEPALLPRINTLEFPPGADAIKVAFGTVNDSLTEGPETVTLTLRDDSAYIIGSAGEATVVILDDDLLGMPAVTVRAINPYIPENAMDPGEVIFERTGVPASDLLVYYSLSGTATLGIDYHAPPGVLLIPAGQSSAILQISPIDDKEVEPDETITVTVEPGPGYGTAESTALLTIVDDDVLTVTVSTTDNGAAEPSQPGRFTVKRDGDLTGNLVVHYSVNGTATSGEDYVPLDGSVTITAGSASADVVVTPLPDTLLEGDESVTVTLASSPGYDVGTPSSATLFIADQQKPTLTISATDDHASEPGDDWGTFVISRGSVTRGSLTVYLAISGTALNGVDYVPLDNMVVIPDGARQATLSLIPFDDLHAEPTEDVEIVLLPNTNYNLGSPMEARVLIEDDDLVSLPAVGFAFTASSAPESESPGILLSLSATSSVPVTVNYQVIGGTASTNDYILPGGPLMIDPGITAKILPLKIIDNSISQANRTIRLALFDPIGATLDGIKIHTYTILDNDAATVFIAAIEPDAYEAGLVPGRFRISRTGDANSDLAVNFQIAGTASAPTHYAPLVSPALIPAGESFVDLIVQPVRNGTVEGPETVLVRLISATGATISSSNQATVTIHDSDLATLPVVTVTSTNHPNAVEGGEPGEFVFYRSNGAGELTVFFSVSGTASPGLNYVPLPDSVTFPAGQASVSVLVNTLDDGLVEGERTVLLGLTQNEDYLTLYPASAMVLLQNMNQRVRLDASDFNASEPGADSGEFTFTRIGSTNGDLRVDYAIGGTAQNGIDYIAIPDSIVIPAGKTRATLPIQMIDDALVEGPETVTLTLKESTDYGLDSPSEATVTLNDDEPTLTLSATTPRVVEGSQRPGVLTLMRTGDPKYEFTAHLLVAGSAIYGIDYPPFPTDVFFACGVTEIDLPIRPVNELEVEGPETVNAMLLPDPAYTILWPSNAVVTIEDAGTNQPPVITFKRPRSRQVNLHGPNVILLVNAEVAEDGDPATLTNTWSQISGPAAVTFGDANSPSTTVAFTNAGYYLIRLTADDGQLQAFSDLEVYVTGPQVFPENLLHWKLDEGSGTIVRDSSRFKRDGQVIGKAAWIPQAVVGGGIELPGANNYIRANGTSNLLDGLKAFSLSLWINLVATNEDQAIFCANALATNGTLALCARQFASCGQGTNVIEATIRTTTGLVRHVSASGALTNGWQHLLLSWTNGSAPALFINGQPDRAQTSYTPLGGVLTNCPQFIIGKGPAEAPFSLYGQVDEVILFPRALETTEAAGLGGAWGIGGGAGPGTGREANFGPDVDAGRDVTVQLPVSVELSGTVTDDGLPDPPATVSNAWVLVSGPADVTIPDLQSLTNSVKFSETGSYVFRLVADDGDVMTCDEVNITVTEPTRVDIFASDPEGAELGPDTAEFTLMRSGDTNFDLTVYLEFSGIASNGVDFVMLTNALTFPSGIDTLPLLVTPYLDHRTEGDQDLTLTIATNIAYAVGNGQATIIIHDSPFGVWTINHFTLEELTDPALSGEDADFDHDGLVNFVEYSANFEPKVPDTNAPARFEFLVDPSDAQKHVTVTYHRRLPPTDVAYAVSVSDDLISWNTGTNYVEELQVRDDGNGLTETVTAQLKAPLPTSGNQFVAVLVWLLATEPPH